MTTHFSRREFAGLLGGAAAFSLSPLTVPAQPGRVPRVGVFLGAAPAEMDDADAKTRVTAFVQGMEMAGWIDGRNVRFEYRWSSGSAESIRKSAQELVALTPDVIVCWGAAAVASLTQATQTIPIVFASVVDPVGAGIVESQSRPGGNVTGFMGFEYSLSGKWMELLKDVAPSVKRVAVLRDAALTAGIGQFAVVQSVAPSVGMEAIPINVRDAGEIERAITNFARISNGGLIGTASALTVAHRDLILALAARHRLPGVFFRRLFVDAGGLISYGPDTVEGSRLAAGYVDRILKGEKPADLPVQAPTKYELVVNLKTAKALGLDVPATVLTRADEVIE
jgi:putative ABC transport system substrate-binding protein